MTNNKQKNQHLSGKYSFDDAIAKARESLGVKSAFSGMPRIQDGVAQHWPAHNPNEGKVEEAYQDNDDYKL